ncbi:glycosyl transferase group 1 [Stanieria cyanosphaera PCC 7437]|uniref:Glycosyl transferase group 1 n=1 Tax=Stanieria cyanosphaera (strain ATCC 29371 / PCC 7437) TaxID=111780 RepID=K9XSG7_STAC7|nr:glycosyltransferase [Stanieria cyanosphaera]AFZ35029.1 glycosyl transferase group 1 [Stanieria cyanosphaera PCC 7437]
MLGIDQNRQQTKVEETANRLLLFELNPGGHHPGYLQHLIKYWCAQQFPGHLDVLISREFADKHPQIVSLGNNHSRVTFVQITPEEQNQLFNSEQLEHSFSGRIKRAFQEYQILSRYTKVLGTTHCFLMYLDTILLRLAISSKLPCRFSCIYFRPIFHYANFPSYSSEDREWLWRWRDRVCLPRLLNSSYLDTLFCLDSVVIEELNRMSKSPKAIHLPDPVQIYNHPASEIEQLKNSLAIEPGRKVFLLFGALSERKGLFKLLEAITTLTPELSQQLCLLLVGPITPRDQASLEAHLTKLPNFVQIIRIDRFIPDEEIQPYFQISDVILAPYQRHIGMSAILVRAATAQKPVLASHFGLMGEITRRYQLGLAVDSTIPAQIAEGLCRFLQTSPEALCNRSQMNQFAQINQAELFAEKIFNCLTKSKSTRGGVR